jgi:membrane protease YdiL (CAAX protease family)
MIDQLAKYKTKEFNTKYIILFFLIAFGWTWFWWFLFISGVLKMPAGVGTPDIDLGTAGPILLIIIFFPFGTTIGGFVVTALSSGRTGVKDLWKQFWNRNLKFKWLLVLILFYPILYLFTRYCSQLFFGLKQPPLDYLSTPWLIIPPFIASILNDGLSEEFGWRGYALRHFQSKWSALTSALILGFSACGQFPHPSPRSSVTHTVMLIQCLCLSCVN